MQSFHAFMEAMRPHWSWLALVFTWVGICLVAVRRRRHWRRATFLTQVNFSLNYRVGNSLAMRTLIEREVTQVWLNEYGVKRVLAAAARTTEENPFIVFKNPKEQSFVNRAVLNVLSARFAETFVAASLGVPVRSATYYFAVTCERFANLRTIKIRVLLMDEQTMLELFGPEAKSDLLDVLNPIYSARLQTLRKIHELYRKDQGAENPVLGQVELGVVLGCPAGVDPASLAGIPCATSSSATA